MNRRMKKLQNELALEQAAPALDAAVIRRRVNAALNAAPSERKAYMRQKIKMAAVLAAAAVALTGTALAVASQWDALSVFFEGDTSPAAEYLQTPNASLDDGNFKVTLESSVTDGQNVFLILKVQALTKDAKTRMAEPYFVDMGTFDFRTIDADGQIGGGGLSYGPLAPLDEDSQSFSLQLMELSPTTERVYLKFGFLPADMTLDIPFDHQADTVELTADFAAKDRNGRDYFFTGITLSPLTFQFHYRNPEGDRLLDPVYFFRMADGSIKTMSQLLDFNQAGGSLDGTGNETESYTFLTVLDTAAFDAVIVGGKAFPLDGGAPEDVTVDPKLYPFRLPLMSRVEEGGALFLPVRALCDGLGAACIWDASALQSVTLSYRDVTLVLTLGSKTMLVNGEAVALDYASALENGLLKLNPSPFIDAWGTGTMVLYEWPDYAESEWEITP